jgi:PAS domain S-box-containing protein
MPNEENKSGEQKAAEAEVESFRKDLGPFVVAAETTRMAMVFTDAKEPYNPIIFANDSFLSLSGHDREEVLGQSFNFLMARGANPEALAEIEAAFEGSSDSDPEIRYRRKDGSVFWASIYISPVRDEGGDVVQHFASFMDLTKHKREKDRLRFLLDELNHRTQNTLATVQAIAVQTLRGVADKEVIDAFEGRILALSKAHTLLGRENWDGVIHRRAAKGRIRASRLRLEEAVSTHISRPELLQEARKSEKTCVFNIVCRHYHSPAKGQKNRFEMANWGYDGVIRQLVRLPTQQQRSEAPVEVHRAHRRSHCNRRRTPRSPAFPL